LKKKGKHQSEIEFTQKENKKTLPMSRFGSMAKSMLKNKKIYVGKGWICWMIWGVEIICGQGSSL